MAQANAPVAPALKGWTGRIINQEEYMRLSPEEKVKLTKVGDEYLEFVNIPPTPAPPASSKGLAAGALSVACFATVLAIAAFFFPTTDGFVSSDDVAKLVDEKIAKLPKQKTTIDDVDGLPKALNDLKASVGKAPTAGNPGDPERSDKSATTAGGITQNVTVCVGASCTDASGKPAAKPVPQVRAPITQPSRPAVSTPAPAVTAGKSSAGSVHYINPLTGEKTSARVYSQAEALAWVKGQEEACTQQLRSRPGANANARCENLSKVD